MNVIFLYPEFPDTFWSFKHSLKFIRKKSAFPPLGLLTVAALLPPDWKKRLIDLNVQKLRDADLAWADYAFISGMVVQRRSAEQLIARCRAAGVTVVAGGPLFTEQFAEFPDVDHFVLNEAEESLPRFLSDLERGSLERVYAADSFADISTTPAPLWDLVDLKHYAEICIQYSRGCPFNCDFCNVTALFGHRPRVKTAAQIIAELDLVYGRGYRGGVFFVDDNFIGNRVLLKKELLPALIAWQGGTCGITFHTEVSINLADDEQLMNMMADAGFDTVFIGIETPDADSLAECSKLQNRNRDLVEDVKCIQRVGLQVQGGFIVGFDHDTVSIFQRQIDFIQKSGIVTAMVGLLQAVPGTRLYERLKSEGRLSGTSSGDNVDGTTNIIPHMSLEALCAGYRTILEQIYAPKNYYRRIRTFLREYKAPQIKTIMRLSMVFAFLRSTVRLGIIGRERLQYWKLLCWTVLFRRELFPLAVTFAIHGFHFRKTLKMHVQ